MEINPPEAGPRRRRKTVVRGIFAVAAMGAFIGWMLGSILVGAIFGAAIGFYGCFRSGCAD